MAGERHGQWIQLAHDWEPDEEFVRGHVTPAEAEQALLAGPGARFVDGRLGYDVEHLEHKWARYGPGSLSGYDRTFIECDEPGRGRFKVTRVSHLEWTPRKPAEGGEGVPK